MIKIFCFLFGDKPIKGLFEDAEVITDKGCKRCYATFLTFNSVWKGARDIPPPGINVKDWDIFCNQKEESARKEFAI